MRRDFGSFIFYHLDVIHLIQQRLTRDPNSGIPLHGLCPSPRRPLRDHGLGKPEQPQGLPLHPPGGHGDLHPRVLQKRIILKGDIPSIINPPGGCYSPTRSVPMSLIGAERNIRS
jgi:hypothetical protein